MLTAHKSKGLEWDVVAVPGLVTGTFPSDQGREAWTAQAKVLPHALRGDADTLPDVDAWDARGLKAFQEAMKDHQHTEELRLGYVTFTRPRSLLLGSGHWWGPTQKTPRGPSDVPAGPVRPLRGRPRRDRGLGGRAGARTRRTRPCARRRADHAWPLPAGRRRPAPAAARPPRRSWPTWRPRVARTHAARRRGRRSRRHDDPDGRLRRDDDEPR